LNAAVYEKDKYAGAGGHTSFCCYPGRKPCKNSFSALHFPLTIKRFGIKYLDSMVENRMNSLYLWRLSFCRLLQIDRDRLWYKAWRATHGMLNTTGMTK